MQGVAGKWGLLRGLLNGETAYAGPFAVTVDVTRRCNLRYKTAEGKMLFCHTLNNTVIASPRILIPIVENYQNADGSVSVPDVLRKHMGGMERIG